MPGAPHPGHTIMAMMTRLYLAALLAALALAPSCRAQKAQPATEANPAESSDPGEAAGWRQLFNGRDLEGWEHVGPGRFLVEDGLLKTEGGEGLLWYTGEKFGNCVLRVVYLVTDESSNSGVFVRIAERPKDEPFAVNHGYEAQICDSQDDYHRTGSIYSLSAATGHPMNPPGQWNTMEITLTGRRIIVTINGQQTTAFDPDQPVPARTKPFEPERGARPEAGYIGLQNHDDYESSRPTHVYFKEVSIRIGLHPD